MDPAARMRRVECAGDVWSASSNAIRPASTSESPTPLREAERRGHGRPAQVAVDEHDVLARGGDGGGQVGGDRRLAVARQGAGDDDHPGRVVDVHVHEVRAQLAERLGGSPWSVSRPASHGDARRRSPALRSSICADGMAPTTLTANFASTPSLVRSRGRRCAAAARSRSRGASPTAAPSARLRGGFGETGRVGQRRRLDGQHPRDAVAPAGLGDPRSPAPGWRVPRPRRRRAPGPLPAWRPEP